MARGTAVGSVGRSTRLHSDISDKDRDALRRLGKKAVLKVRNFAAIEADVC